MLNCITNELLEELRAKKLVIEDIPIGDIATDLLQCRKKLAELNNNKMVKELKYLLFFYQNADFGPAESDVRRDLNDRFQEKTGEELPEGFENED
jgi:hypothetical protein